MKKTAFYSKDKTKLIGVWNYPKTKSDKTIILAHGITVDKEEDGVFTELATRLADSGYNVFRFDFRGHGESGGKSIDMTVSKELEDLTAAVNYVKKKGFKKIALLGASFGGGVAALYAGENFKQLKCLCLWNPVLNYKHTFLNPYLPWIVKRTRHINKDFEKKGWSILGSRKFVIGKQLYKDMARLFPYKTLKNYKKPVIIIHGTKDDAVPYKDSVLYIKGIGRLITIKDGTHGFHNKWETKIAYKETLDFFKKYL